MLISSMEKLDVIARKASSGHSHREMAVDHLEDHVRRVQKHPTNMQQLFPLRAASVALNVGVNLDILSYLSSSREALPTALIS
jgi:hypothetical protein